MAEVFYNDATELATVTNVFSVNSVPTDPTAIVLTVTDPTGTATDYHWPTPADITRTGAGAFTIDVACDSTVEGTWTARWEGTGTAADVTVVTWETFDTAVTKRYCSVEALTSRLGDPTNLDFEMALAIETASRQIDEACSRKFWRGTDTRTYEACGPYQVDVDDLVSVTTLKTDNAGDGTFETTISAADYQLLPVNPVQYTERWPYDTIRMVGSTTLPYAYWPGRTDRVQVVGVFGWPTVPRAVQQACLILSAELLKLKDAPFGVAGMGEWGPIRVRANPMALAMLAPYRKYPILVA